MTLLASLGPGFYKGFLRHPHRQSCWGAICHVFTVCLIVEFFLAGKFVWREQAVLDRLYRSDALAETAADLRNAAATSEPPAQIVRNDPAQSQGFRSHDDSSTAAI